MRSGFWDRGTEAPAKTDSGGPFLHESKLGEGGAHGIAGLTVQRHFEDGIRDAYAVSLMSRDNGVMSMMASNLGVGAVSGGWQEE